MADQTTEPPEKPDEPGEVDEFAGIHATPRRRSPIIAVVVVALGGLVSWHLRADLRYAFAARTPEELGDARSVAGRGVPLEDNRYVVLSGQPDRRDALYIEPRGEKSRQTFYRLLGTGTRLLVRAEDTALKHRIEDRWAGRLRRFDQLPYAQAMRDYYAKNVKAARYLDAATLQAVVEKRAGTVLRDRAGEPLTLDPAAELQLDTANEDQVEVLLSKEKFATDGDARHEVERLGLKVHPGYGTADAFGVLVDAPAAQRNQVIAKLDAEELPFQATQVRYLTRLSALSRAGDGSLAIAADSGEVLRADGAKVPHLPGAVSVPWAQVKAASVEEPLRIADDAFVLAEGELPESFWWAPFIVAVLLAFGVFNVWYLLRAPRRS